MWVVWVAEEATTGPSTSDLLIALGVAVAVMTPMYFLLSAEFAPRRRQTRRLRRPGAAAAFAELLTDRMRVLDPDHPDTLTTRNNLAFWRGEAGDPAGAAAAFAELLTERMRVLGPDHPDTLTTRNNLAHWQWKAGSTRSNQP